MWAPHGPGKLEGEKGDWKEGEKREKDGGKVRLNLKFERWLKADGVNYF